MAIFLKDYCVNSLNFQLFLISGNQPNGFLNSALSIYLKARLMLLAEVIAL